MKKAKFFLLSAFLLCMNACSDDKIQIPEKEPDPVPPEVKPEEKPEEKPEGVENPVNLTLTIRPFKKYDPYLDKDIEESPLTFASGDSATLFDLSSYKIVAHTYVYDGIKWDADSKYGVRLYDPILIAHPRLELVDSTYANVDLNEQYDLILGTHYFDTLRTDIHVNMEHRFSKVYFDFAREDYKGEGKITDVKFLNVPRRAQLDRSGSLTWGELNDSICLNQTFTVESRKLYELSTYMAPNFEKNKCYLTYKLDGTLHKQRIALYSDTRPGYTYRVYVPLRAACEEEPIEDEYVVDHAYWSKFGKDDEIVFKEPDVEDYENWFIYEPMFKFYGKNAYQNDGKLVAHLVQFCGKKEFKGKMRLILKQNGEIVEQMPPVYIHFDKKIYCHQVRMMDYITAEPGTYEIEPIVQREGESTWFHCDFWAEPDEKLIEVLPPISKDIPAVRKLYKSEDPNEPSDDLYIPDNDPFNMYYVLSNKSRKQVKGEIKAVWIRDYSLDSNHLYPSQDKDYFVNNNKWEHEIGRKTVTIPEGVRFWKGCLECKVPVTYPAPRPENNTANYICVGTPLIHLYWRPEGATEWTFMRFDGDHLFQEYGKDAASQNFFTNDKNYSDGALRSWGPK